ncbi:phosphate-starvation-inducible PsiE family protein [Thermosynechococcaceae cyanobacterium BACA0444]|uniref:Phosphate-starvation-inducible PsiE family protein n=1 Tax=Pseudocalidococcus azoricus BACA0444 TaxID=2918990 RepID=A0AAE4FQC3_9CYAN|nr:phosphate-starvation-inducible PsiE family protein [Pseudocalidococcus azoricus]MDS3859367.1 phosphate-starvation-inducible PsiE family protein [Pseudocalidococcus azoricus BACA0444]
MSWLTALGQFIVELAVSDEKFLKALKRVEGLASRILALGMIVVIIAAITDVGRFILTELLTPPYWQFTTDLVRIFGLFLNVLVALEILENITAYLRTDVSAQIVELVIVTALIAIARKIIILNIDQPETIPKLVGLAVSILAVTISYWIIRRQNHHQRQR